MTWIIAGIIYPSFSISPGSVREALCIPFQQTARYLALYPEDITEQEKAAISEVLDYQHMLECYTPNSADPAKSTFNENATSEDLKNYFSAWRSMFLRHPVAYIDATLCQIYGYFYPPAGFLYRVPYKDSNVLMEFTNDKLGIIGADFHYPKSLNRYRLLYEKIGELIARVPPLTIFTLSATYFWWLIVLFFYFIRCRKIHSLIVSLQLLLQFAVCFAGPLGGTCFRYVYPMVLAIIPITYLGVFVEAKNVQFKDSNII